MSTKEKTIVLSINDIKNYKKVKTENTTSKKFRIKDDDVFYKDSPVAKQDVIALDKYCQEYTQTALKTHTAFAVDAFKEDEELESVTYTLPYREDVMRTVWVKEDENSYTVHTEFDVKSFDTSSSLKGRIKALNKAMLEDD